MVRESRPSWGGRDGDVDSAGNSSTGWDPRPRCGPSWGTGEMMEPCGKQQYGLGTPAPGLHSAEDDAADPPGLPLGVTTPAPCHTDPDA